MMFPVVTCSSPNFFTPMYFGLLSRPFFTEPVPFLCAHSMTAVRGALALERDDERRKDAIRDDSAAGAVWDHICSGLRRQVWHLSSWRSFASVSAAFSLKRQNRRLQ